MAEQVGVGFPTVTQKTRETLAGLLDDGYEAENPVDAWGAGHDFENQFRGCMQALLEDENAALGLWIADISDGFWVHEGYCRAAAEVAKSSGKPLAFATCYAHTATADFSRKLLEAGIPLLKGLRPTMVAVSAALNYREFQARPKRQQQALSVDAVDYWKGRLASGESIDENDGLSLLAEFGIDTPRREIAEDRQSVLAAADRIGYPVVLKTAMPGIDHKSDSGGVILDLKTHEELAEAYDGMAASLGPRVMVAEMASPGIEIALGIFQDPQFGPMVMIGAGGTLVEVLDDTVFAVPPFDRRETGRLIDRLRLRPVLDGVRGKPPVDVDALAQAAARLGGLAAALGPSLQSLDINPMIVSETGAVAVDALIAASKGDEG